MNNKIFAVQRCVDGKYSEDIGNINAAGTTSLLIKYHFTDYDIL